MLCIKENKEEISHRRIHHKLKSCMAIKNGFFIIIKIYLMLNAHEGV